MRRHLQFVVAAILMAELAACGTGSKEGPPMSDGSTPSVSYDAAFSNAQRYARHVVDAVSPKASGLSRGPFSDSPVVSYCSNSDGAPPGTPVNIEFDYQVKGVSKSDIKRYFANFRKVLESEGWKRLYGSLESGGLAMGKGGFSLLLTYAPSNGLLSLGVETPCVAPKDPDHPLDVPSGL